MWKIYEHKDALKGLKSLPIDILKRYEKWKDIVAISGPAGLKQILGFKDEALRGEWKGCRSSRLNIQYRIIYKIDNDQLFVKIINVTAHDYRRK
ncbi:MAG: type II toxin-antitoxin system mRNA interferase toxin, RelE/StbE family [Cycloclasticus sp.]|nr:MAG: type II toxin-antitoxin system mRNA interferase toxin, RelE/StbE family [Cycloclasticus sp.]